MRVLVVRNVSVIWANLTFFTWKTRKKFNHLAIYNAQLPCIHYWFFSSLDGFEPLSVETGWFVGQGHHFCLLSYLEFSNSDHNTDLFFHLRSRNDMNFISLELRRCREVMKGTIERKYTHDACVWFILSIFVCEKWWTRGDFRVLISHVGCTQNTRHTKSFIRRRAWWE